jgi:hypothetical protein
MRGNKALVMDKALSGPLGLIAEKQLIKDHGVEKTYHLRNEPLETDQRRIMYLVRATMENMKVAIFITLCAEYTLLAKHHEKTVAWPVFTVSFHSAKNQSSYFIVFFLVLMLVTFQLFVKIKSASHVWNYACMNFD